MTRRQWLRRRLLWTGVVLGALLLFAAVEVLRAGLAAGEAIGRLATSTRRLAY